MILTINFQNNYRTIIVKMFLTGHRKTRVSFAPKKQKLFKTRCRPANAGQHH